MGPQVPLIKGYLPVRLRLPASWNETYEDETYFYVREHHGKQELPPTAITAAVEKNTTKNATLFVANAPIVPGISSKVLLKSIFGRFGQVHRVTVVQNPRTSTHGSTSAHTNDSNSTYNQAETTLGRWSDKFPQRPTFLPPILAGSEGKYAHVVFSSSKELKKTMRALQDVMKIDNKTKNKKGEQDSPVGLSMEPIEIQTLVDESTRLYQEHLQLKYGLGMSQETAADHPEDDTHDDNEKAEGSGIWAVLARYHSSCNLLRRDALLEECNSIMETYEAAEEAKKRAIEEARSQPDDDGFVTVSYSNAVGSQVELEQQQQLNNGTSSSTALRRKGQKRNRRKKEALGAQELSDFYKFQRRENKKRTLEDLRTQFEEDLKRVKRMKEERQYRPF